MALALTDRETKFLAILLLAAMFTLSFLSMKDDALTFDELAHIPAGYSYLTQQDYRINPEHPPLAKDLAAFPLLFLNLNFPEQSQNWLQEKEAPAWWVQFDLGTEFLYQSGNDPQEIIHFARFPMILLLLALGWLLFTWARALEGNKAGLLVLLLFAFSPAFLAHGRLVTTDVAAAFGAVLAIFVWIRFLKNPGIKAVVAAGTAFGIAMLLKFTLVLLIPFFLLVTLLYPSLFGFSWKRLLMYAGKALLAGIIGIVFIVFPVYALHTANYPQERQIRDTAADLSVNGFTLPEKVTLQMAESPVLRPLAQYARGVLMALQRSSIGNTTYFQGQIASSGWWYYFPVLYLFKVPISFHILSLLSILGILFSLWRKKIIPWLKQNFQIFVICLFVIIYWGSATLGNLNIGIRHMLPAFPFIYLLLAWSWSKLLYSNGRFSEPSPPSVKNRPGLSKVLFGILAILLAWYAGSSLAAFPHYISYYNELAGGTDNGYKIATDSNYDWGQDFYLLQEYVEENDIKKLYLDYFGGEYPQYWLGQRYVKLDPQNPPEKGWVAVSVNQLMGGIAEPAKGFDQPTGYYSWLKDKTPTAKAGNSIFIYQLD